MKNIIYECITPDMPLSYSSFLSEIAEFVVSENYNHHGNITSHIQIEKEKRKVLEEELYLCNNYSQIYVARDTSKSLIGCIRVVKWDKRKILPIEKIFGVNPLNIKKIKEAHTCWHVGRFAIVKNKNISSIKLFKYFLNCAISKVIREANSCIIAEIDNRLLQTIRRLGISAMPIGEKKVYLASETIPVYINREGVLNFYNKTNKESL